MKKRKIGDRHVEERLNKFIANCGVCSRRKADEYIVKGFVTVNGNVVTELGTKVSLKDNVCINGKEITVTSEKKYILINKPIGYITTAKEQFNRPCVLDLIYEKNRVFPVGRLDMFSEGMLILTNDGDFVNRIIHPKEHICKTYEVELNKNIENDAILRLKSGVDIGGYITKPAKAEKTDERNIRITIYEGKNRQIRKMCEALGFKVKKLKRISIGKLNIGSMKPGEYRYLTQEDINKIFEK